ncbi:MAG: D-2-hydroxyacid dehydrogenase [Gammaproteobacteria bacterium]|nr:D-2-hydroxyacid dehydrogenase [Gammaproteobacteria bacterium]
MRGVFLDFATISNNDVDTTRLDAALPTLEYHAVTRAGDLAERVKSAEVILTNKIALGEEVFAAAPDLDLIVLAATGTNNVDLEAAKENGIAVYNIRDYCTSSVVQHVYALILALTRHVRAYQRLLETSAWSNSPQFCMLDYPIRELDGKTLGVVGYGALGKAVADVAKAFGLRVVVARRPGEQDARDDRVSLEDLLGEADIVSLHCPLTPATEKLIGQAELDLMKEDALLINTARGALVDEEALAMALRSGRLGGAGIDVLSEEPPAHGNPLLTGRIPNLIVTPHVAWAAREARQRAVDAMARNIEAFSQGNDTNRVA